MRKRLSTLIIFILSSISLLISIKLFYNMGIYVDEHNTSPDIVVGSEFWLSMDWIRLLLLFMIVIISGVNLLRENEEIE